MKLKGESAGKLKLHSNDATFVGVDAYPADELHKGISNSTRMSYVGVLISKPEVFENLPQWKETGSLEDRLVILEKIYSLVNQKNVLTVCCFHVHILKGAGYQLGAHLLADFINKKPDKVTITARQRNSVRFKFETKTFKELQAVSMMTMACAITALCVAAIKITAAERFEAVRTPIMQFLLDNVSGNAELNNRLIKYMIENTELASIIGQTIKKSECVGSFGLQTPQSNKILDGDEIEGVNNIPLMIGTDWFTRIASEYQSIQDESVDVLDETQEWIVKIVESLTEKGGYFAKELPTIGLERPKRLLSVRDQNGIVRRVPRNSFDTTKWTHTTKSVWRRSRRDSKA